MRGLARDEVSRIREIEARLSSLRIGERSAVEEAISAVRELIGADNAIFYSLAETDAGWSIDRWHHVRGESNATFAANLDVSLRAIELHVTALLGYAGVDSRAALVAAVLLS
jgi:hypothetical protein